MQDRNELLRRLYNDLDRTSNNYAFADERVSVRRLDTPKVIIKYKAKRIHTDTNYENWQKNCIRMEQERNKSNQSD